MIGSKPFELFEGKRWVWFGPGLRSVVRKYARRYFSQYGYKGITYDKYGISCTFDSAG